LLEISIRCHGPDDGIVRQGFTTVTMATGIRSWVPRVASAGRFVDLADGGENNVPRFHA
jgi:hypothetical protein